MTTFLVIATIVVWLIFAVPTIQNLNIAKRRLADARWELSKVQFKHMAKFAAGRVASTFFGPVGSAVAGRVFGSLDHSSASDATHHALSHAAHAVHEAMPIIGWGWSIGNAVRGYMGDPQASSYRSDVDLWEGMVKRYGRLLTFQTISGIVVLLIILL